MDILRHRPLFCGCLVFMTVLVAGAFLQPAGMWLLGGSLTAGALLFAFIRFRRRESPRACAALIGAALACLALARGYQTFQSPDTMALRSLEHTTARITGVITDRRGSGGYMTAYTLSLDTVNGAENESLVILTCSYPADLRPGNRVELEAEVLPLSEAAGDSYDALSLAGDGYVAGLLSEDESAVILLEEDSGLWRARAGNLRRMLSARLDLTVGREGGGLPSSLLLGDRSRLEDSARRDFARAGVAHLLAISGLHMTILFGAFAGCLGLLGVPKRLRALILCGGMAGYLLLLGFPPSATRAAIMLGVTFLSHFFFARADSLTSLGLAGGLILAVTPYAVADAGFWMSFLATLGLVTLMPVVQASLDRPARKSLPLWRSILRARLLRVLSALAVGILAVSFTLFVVATVIGELSLLSPLSTLLVTPLCGAILLLSLLCLPLTGTAAGGVIGYLIGEICGISLRLTRWLAAPSWVVVSLREPSIASVVMGIAALMTAATLVLLVVRLPAGRRGWVLAPLLAGWLTLGSVLAVHGVMTRDRVAVTYLQPSAVSEAMVLVSGREGFICDLSNGSLSALTSAADEAKQQGATELGAVMLTHYHGRTSGALDTLLARETVRSLWAPIPQNEEEYDILLSLAEKAEGAGVVLFLYRDGETVPVLGKGEARLARTYIERSQQPVLLVSVDMPSEGGGEERLAYCGSAVFESDLAEEAEAWLSDADVVIFGSHGPILKRPFGAGLSLARDCSVILSAFGDTAAYVEPACLPEGGSIWKGQKRWSIRTSQ